ncbi:hypothetical protein [Alicyclobacillus acidoterrestris]|uniref:Uncharacterized protein n=1 Tax=Alicyclobacillus acidoterrestris (strain ATCC 49025 / DSM 3922 / CIP 106132 / NCIMB 13137 / GD3B) TaxID=1356854 RepID=T0DE22_ALIAG|nr:hypothetical protein [Alicyclobacillus acidoterrestris]EPZ47876.1 hypothetical protein N007_04770 [Alicyclobacillus acidoterrestris ATCC 49025]UNO51057.1 hypothetical protein K1I37_21000 [Alicyclobacillus acidoterrestris]GEO27903.1 VWA domain-containing protein [Alicyclobacillus acidoterrestris]
MSRDLRFGSIETDRFDRRTFQRVYEESTKLQEAVNNQQIDGVIPDVWASLYKSAPSFASDASVVNKRVMETLMAQSAWKDLRGMTQFDEYGSAIGSLDLQKKLDGIIPDDVKNAAQAVHKMQQQLQQLLDQAEAYSDAAGGDLTSPAQHKADELHALANELRQALNGAEAIFNEAYDTHGSSIAREMRQALDETVDLATQDADAMHAFGIEPGNGNPVNGAERLLLADMLRSDPKIREIAKLAGRMQMIALKKRRNRTQHPPTEVVNITLGDDLSRLVPSELALLADPDTEEEFLLRFAEKRLLQYELKGYEREGQGPIVVCIDESGSTEGVVEKWLKGIALSLFAIASREKRAFAVIHFASRGECYVQKWANPRIAPATEIIEMACHFFDGGTSFEEPLREAVKVMDDSAFQKGDIVFLTDGAASVSDEFLNGEFRRVKSEKNFNVISVVIGHSDTAVRPFTDQLAKPQVGDDDTLSFVIESLN